MNVLSDKDINELQKCNKKIWVTTDDIEKIVEDNIQEKLGLNIHESFNDVEISYIKASKLYNNTSLYIYYSMYLLFNIDMSPLTYKITGVLFSKSLNLAGYSSSNTVRIVISFLPTIIQ